jgi:CRISPR/Cas system-associated exonuclease Cas4 (RecB family)
MAYKRYEQNKPYVPGQKAPYKISRSKIDLFIECPRCFWLDARLKISRPEGPRFTLNLAVDDLLKKEFDALRKSGQQHPLQVEYGIDARPAFHEMLNTWRHNFTGVQYLHEPTHLLVYGAIDDLWQNSKGEYVVLDYKATSKAGKIEQLGTDPWHDSYRRQLEIYQWLLRKNGLKVSNKGYWVYCNALKNRDDFNRKLEFELTLVDYEGNDKWVEPTLFEIKKLLDSDDIPNPSSTCQFCHYIRQQSQAFKKKKSQKKI